MLRCVCDHCGTKLKVPVEHAGTEVICPTCQDVFVARDPRIPLVDPVMTPGKNETVSKNAKSPASRKTVSRQDKLAAKATDQSETPTRKQSRPKAVICPNCEERLPGGSVFCVGCGYDLRTGETSTLEIRLPNETKQTKRKRVASIESESALPEITWRNVLSLPWNLEMVLLETVELTMWSLLWSFLYLTISVCLMVIGSPTLIFIVSAVIAGMLNLWLNHKGLSIFDLLHLIAGLLAVSAIAALVLDRLLPGRHAEMPRGFGIALLVFMMLALLLVVCATVQFFFSKYFALVRKGAFLATFTDDDDGGMFDLLMGIVVSVIASGPFLVFLIGIQIYSLVYGLESQSLYWLMVVVLAGTILWSSFYFPIGCCVAGIRRSCNPFVVLWWFGQMTADYLAFWILYVPFRFVIAALSGLAVSSMLHLWEGSPLAIVLTGLYAFLIDTVLSQYFIVLATVGTGMLANMNERNLRWHRVKRQRV